VGRRRGGRLVALGALGVRDLVDVARELGLEPADLLPCGRAAAKVELRALERTGGGAGRLVLVSAMSPTRAGEGKTTVSVALAMGLRTLGRRAAVCLREPSLGPVFGLKGGGTGGGRAQVVPGDAINLHFTGDLHAVTSAHNLLAALVDNALHFLHGDLDPRRTTWRRVLDVNDRALRNVVTGLGERGGGVPRDTGFSITAASEVMAALCLAESHADLEARLARVVVGRSIGSRFVTAGELDAAGPMTALLRDALLPNLVQTSDGGPALVHGGPFANIAHGCSSVLATRLALRYADDVVTEAGFGFDLGGEKYLHIKARGRPDLWPRCVVLVATVRAVRAHGRDDLEAGLANLDHHLERVAAFGLPVVVALNAFADDAEDDLRALEAHLERRGVTSARCHGYHEGAPGAVDLARAVAPLLDAAPPAPRALYPLEADYADKLTTLAREVYGADGVWIDPKARRRLRRFAKAGYADLPVCVAKTPYSLSDAPDALGRPRGFTVSVRDAELAAGAGFVVALTGEVVTMPGLPRHPNAGAIRLDGEGKVEGVVG